MNAFPLQPSSWRRQCFRHDPITGWWHIPRIQALLELGGTRHMFRTNAVGMRSDKEYPLDTPAGRKRIILLGDSYSAGDGVSNGSRFGDILEALHPRLDMLNFGCNGTGTDQQMLIYENKAACYEHDAVLWCICVENIIRNLCSCRPSYHFGEHQLVYRAKPYFSLHDGSLTLCNVPVPAKSRNADSLQDWYCAPYHHTLYEQYTHSDQLPWLLMEAMFLRLAKAIAPRPLLIAPFPMQEHYMEVISAQYMEAFETLPGLAENIHIIDVLPVFLRQVHATRTQFYFPSDPHYTLIAHHFVAQAVDVALGRFVPEMVGL